MKDNILFFIMAIVYLAILYALVRPNSKGPAIIKVVFDTFSDLVRGIAGETYNSSTKTWSTNSNA